MDGDALRFVEFTRAAALRSKSQLEDARAIEFLHLRTGVGHVDRTIRGKSHAYIREGNIGDLPAAEEVAVTSERLNPPVSSICNVDLDTG